MARRKTVVAPVPLALITCGMTFAETAKKCPAGSNPLWHTRNLQAGKSGSYLSAYGLDPVNDPLDQLTGVYQYNYSPTLVASWLWNNSKKVFLSIEDEESIQQKANYIASRNLGGVMFWELAGDYSYDSDKGESSVTT